MRDRIIRIFWHPPLPLEEALKDKRTARQGLYYITWVFGGQEISLYLGIARYQNTIRRRLESHWSSWLEEYRRGALLVRIGQIVYPRDKNAEIMGEIIDHAESAILYHPDHRELFPENVGKRSSYSYSHLYRVENEGDRFQLAPVIRMHEQE